MRTLSLAQYRQNIHIVGERSALFQYKKEIFEALDMGLSHAQVHDFLTVNKGLKISRQALTAWLKKHRNTKQKAQIFEPSQKPVQNKENSINTKHQESKVEPILPSDMASIARAKLEASATEAGIDLSDLPQGLYSMFAHQILKD